MLSLVTLLSILLILPTNLETTSPNQCHRTFSLIYASKSWDGNTPVIGPSTEGYNQPSCNNRMGGSVMSSANLAQSKDHSVIAVNIILDGICHGLINSLKGPNQEEKGSGLRDNPHQPNCTSTKTTSEPTAIICKLHQTASNTVTTNPYLSNPKEPSLL